MAMLALGAAVLIWRGLELTLTRKDFLQTQGDARYLREVTRSAHRGMILDRNGEPLAVSTPVDSIWADPSELAAQRDQWARLARAIGMKTEQIHRLLASRADREFVYLKRHVDPDVAARVQALGITGVGLQREYRRYYPTGEVAGHVLGFTNVDDVGQEGLELAYEEWLRGTPGSKRVIRDRLGRIVEDVESIRSPEPGRDLRLTLDRRIQYLAYRALKRAVRKHGARSGSLVVLDPLTGEVLAMVNQPSYNPNNRADRISRRFRNRAVTDVFEPGSTIKPFTVAASLEAGQLRPDTVIDTAPGLLRVGRHTVRDIRNYGAIDVRTVIQKSSNVGASKIALALPRETLWKHFSSLGFGTPAGIDYPGESAGILSGFQRWGQIHRATLAFGYGLSVTAVQLGRAYGVLAADGVLRPLTLSRAGQPAAGQRVVSARTTRDVRRMLEYAVADGGTGARAAVPGYRVAGKTGTVKKTTANGYAEDRHLAVFAGMVPASRPRLVTVVVIDEPAGEKYYGGEVAAPAFAEVMAGSLRILAVAPDGTPRPGDRMVMRVVTDGASEPLAGRDPG